MESKTERGIKTVTQMRQKVKHELSYIPRGIASQNFLRQVYSAIRLKSLGKKAETEKNSKEVLLEAIKIVKKDIHNFKPKYDKKFFDKKDV